MKIGVVAPSPVPFTVGGAENLFWGLQDYFNLETSHQCEVIKLPSRESNFWEIIDSYERFLSLDLSYFDVLISTKYPAWMVSHPRHVCYMQHTLRGLYDTYHFCRQPEMFAWAEPALGALKKCMEQVTAEDFSNGSRLFEFFSRLRELRNTGIPDEVFRFPGPFIREIVHFLDGYGLSPRRITRYAAISANVRNRANYFPRGAEVSVFHHPPRLKGYRCGGDDYLFTASRLDGAKRIRLLIEAMRQVKSDIPLLIAGTGPDEEQLRALAERDQRVRFLGFVRDAELLEYYADALAVPFVPYDEDYGLITIEAMKSGKPVLTFTDSGGSNEFVRNGETGFSVPPEPDKLAERIDYMCTHRDEARRMGKTARELVKTVTWKAVADGLLTVGSRTAPTASARPSRPVRETRKKLVATTTFPIFPPRGGGQSRIYHLYRYLARSFDIEIVSLCNHGEPSFDEQIAPGLREIRVPKSQAHQSKESDLSRSVEWVPITDAAMPILYKETPAYVAALRDAARDAFAVVASHPYTIHAMQECAPGKPIWFEAHNVEYALKRDIFPDSDAGRKLLEIVRETEARAWQSCSLAFACTRADLDALSELYGANTALKLEVPNGVCFEESPYSSESDRRKLKERLGLAATKVALFMGSWHGPNLTAVEYVFELANKLPEVTFLVIGSAGLAFRDRQVPPNVLMTGTLEDDEKSILLGAADIALNPVIAGSGSNLKMLDYAAASLPILSTAFGARGFDFAAGRHYLSAELATFPLELTAALATPSSGARIASAARELVASRYLWNVIARQFASQVAVLCS
jgi:glycosyltransferase involved in cell wall biosynthesis